MTGLKGQIFPAYTFFKCFSEMYPVGFPQLIILLKVSPQSQIIPLRSTNKKVLYPDHKETLSPVAFTKIDSSH